MRFLFGTALFIAVAAVAFAAPQNRITGPINGGRVRALTGGVRLSAQPRFARGAVDPGFELRDVTMVFQVSGDQRRELDLLLAEQQNPGSAQFHKWLTPEAFGEQFGLSAADQAQVVQWLGSQGLTVTATARARNWVRFSGTAERVSSALRTSFQRYNVSGEEHFANSSAPQVPEALADITAGFIGLDDFGARPRAQRFRPVPEPHFNSGANHYLAPQDFSTIYNLGPLAAGGYDGTGQSIVVVGQSAITLSDVRAFRTRFGLPANDPVLIPYSTDPGFNGAQIEGNLDVQWAGAIAPRATINYVFGTSAFTATIAAINLNISPVITISYGLCELDIAIPVFRAALQQGNAQGITILASSGDSGAAGCEAQGLSPYATVGRYADFPAVAPEVTAVGGTQFNEGSGTYWGPTNSPNLGSALGYIPEKAWNESDQQGLLSSGGGASVFVEKPAWQRGPGVPADKARDVPDVSLSAALHGAYLIYYQGGLGAVGGTSASAPSLAGVIALLNQYQVRRGFQAKAGLGNINPQLYRMAVNSPAAFHDIVDGDNVVPCLQGTQDCETGSFGYKAGPGYDLATGVGTIDANAFVTQFNQTGNPVTVSLIIAPNPVTINETVALFATVTPPIRNPFFEANLTGVVEFSNGTIALGSAPIESRLSFGPSASLIVPASLIGFGTVTITASYSGDANFSGGGATGRIRVTAPAANLSAVTLAAPASVFALPADPNGVSWPITVTLTERNNVPAIVTGYSIDGQPQKLADLFPAPAIPAGRSISARIVLRGQTTPAERLIEFTGTDASGTIWTRQAKVYLQPLPDYIGATVFANPLVMQRSPAAPADCQWSQRITLDNTFGSRLYVQQLFNGDRNISNAIVPMFGSAQLEAWGSLSGKMCWSDIKTPETGLLTVVFSNDSGQTLTQNVQVAFEAAAAAPAKLTAKPSAVTINANTVGPIPPVAILNVDVTDSNQAWTASVFPANRTTSWLRLSQTSGSGPATIQLQGDSSGFQPGVYRATVVIQSQNAVPQYVEIPVMFVNGATPGTAITGTTNALSFKTGAAPGMILAVYGAGLAAGTQTATVPPLPFSLGGTSVTVNGVPAPVFYASPNQLNVQVPYWVGSGPAVLGVNNGGAIAGYHFQILAASPGILTDGAGSTLPQTVASPGGSAFLYVTGDGVVSPTLDPGYAPPGATPLGSLPRPVQPLGVTVGGVQALVSFYGLTPGVVGLTQVNYLVPAGSGLGRQPVVVTVGGVSSPAAFIDIAAKVTVGGY
ncbi:MAG: peptidase and in, kexin, sedolisin [Bryobacterales bacterium]|nr:peptidase and in, kexin, sedolisin [Bryobacterales bacterium]